MTHWPFWLSGVALTGAVLTHWALTRRMMAVSGRFTKIVDRAREGPDEASDMTEAELAEAIREMTLAEFGPTAAEEKDSAVGEAEPVPAVVPRPAAPQSATDHAVFLVALALGGLCARAISGPLSPTFGLEGVTLAAFTGGSSVALFGMLFGGGILVGFGTRMAGGCTSGHGLCGVSRFQLGSLVATLSFFGAGIATSFALGALR